VNDLALAEDVAREAGALLRDLATRARPEVSAKSTPTDLVSAADLAAERLIRERLAAARPGDGVLGEEGGDAAGTSGRRWVVDPLDGTEWFARGIPIWGTLIALEDERGPLVAVVSAPALRRRWWAARGEGAYRDGARIRVSGTPTVEAAFVAHANLYLGFPIDAHALLAEARVSGGFESFLAPMLCAEGAADAAIAPRGFLWDLLPAQLIVEEAGGRFTDFDGRRTAVGRGLIAANPALHAEVLQRLAAAE
jgi:histidinol-phosphatase